MREQYPNLDADKIDASTKLSPELIEVVEEILALRTNEDDQDNSLKIERRRVEIMQLLADARDGQGYQ